MTRILATQRVRAKPSKNLFQAIFDPPRFFFVILSSNIFNPKANTIYLFGSFPIKVVFKGENLV